MLREAQRHRVQMVEQPGRLAPETAVGALV
jgi:hypothetical protein